MNDLSPQTPSPQTPSPSPAQPGGPRPVLVTSLRRLVKASGSTWDTLAGDRNRWHAIEQQKNVHFNLILGAAAAHGATGRGSPLRRAAA